MVVPSGKDHPHWRGGVSEYPNHSRMKINRLIVLKKSKGKCEVCGDRATQVHHKDENKSNHKLSNLCPICTRCHYAVHAGRQNPRGSKYEQLYGASIPTLARRFEVGESTVQLWHTKGTLKDKISELKQKKG